MNTRLNTSTRVESEHEHKSGDLAQELRVSTSTREESEHKHESGV